jgi:hypothetical protein
MLSYADIEVLRARAQPPIIDQNGFTPDDRAALAALTREGWCYFWIINCDLGVPYAYTLDLWCDVASHRYRGDTPTDCLQRALVDLVVPVRQLVAQGRLPYIVTAPEPPKRKRGKRR